MYELKSLGFNNFFSEQIQATPYEIGRVATSANGIYKLLSSKGEFLSQVSGKFRHLAEKSRDFPCVGDWVLFEPLIGEPKGVIHSVLTRNSLLSRHVAGEKNEEQLMAANVDTVFLVNALNQDFNLRRMERYLMQVYESGASPVFVLTKRDLCSNLEEKVQAVEEIALGVPIIPVDALHNDGVEAIQALIKEGQTVSLLGSSGVGKSTLVNRLIGKETQKTQDIREEDAKGRHTTTHRELFLLEKGGVIIDTPGMRELQLWSGEEAASETFKDIETLADQCKFRDCHHEQEPGCAIKIAIENGELSSERYKSYVKLQREAKFLALKDKYGTHRASRIQGQAFRKQNG
ncbi:ribosome biogenesis GTPase [Pullulanibacillus pueri]|uniref:Small ribosomal subunit biogenesis GTPase RsgA n=1 Tax=Pullulanibacillus pueri TaxID=1437324 RepID=A0A8J3EN99_9BACL|nr:ribosome small subunit-dependent GTPase A [Pullulanibacillus pueri]MBM7683776.1 ribosome biogenesis GTPase [Pullulanibacillus pueri]GGH87281.1 putative ribosome biogenesis GTPase RsgA [Pullulanibacillus pueri]